MPTFVFADLAGYTALTEAHGDERAADAAAAFCRDTRALLPAYGAAEVKTIGDALLLTVEDAGQALELAARLVGDHGARHRSLGIRVGLHTGDAIHREGDWFGAAVNLASRVADLAYAGEVVFTAATRQAAIGVVGEGRVRSRGVRRVKNVREPVELFVLAPEVPSGRVLPIDPVCRMAIDPVLAGDESVYRGARVYFCSTGCGDAFRSSPERYWNRGSRRANTLVSDRARERAAGRLSRAYALGRLDPDELDRRSERVWSARVRADLAALTYDLPRRRRRRPPVYLWPFWPAVVLSRSARRRVGSARRTRRASG